MRRCCPRALVVVSTPLETNSGRSWSWPWSGVYSRSPLPPKTLQFAPPNGCRIVCPRALASAATRRTSRRASSQPMTSQRKPANTAIGQYLAVDAHVAHVTFNLDLYTPLTLNFRRARWSLPYTTSVDTITQWREDWSSSSVVNHTIVTDPSIRQPGFHLPRHTWSLMNRFRTGQGPCRANLHNYGVSPMQSPSCDCGQRQTMNHTIDTCPLTEFEGGLNLPHEANDDAVIWLESAATGILTDDIRW